MEPSDGAARMGMKVSVSEKETRVPVGEEDGVLRRSSGTFCSSSSSAKVSRLQVELSSGRDLTALTMHRMILDWTLESREPVSESSDWWTEVASESGMETAMFRDIVLGCIELVKMERTSRR